MALCQSGIDINAVEQPVLPVLQQAYDTAPGCLLQDEWRSAYGNGHNCDVRSTPVIVLLLRILKIWFLQAGTPQPSMLPTDGS